MRLFYRVFYVVFISFMVITLFMGCESEDKPQDEDNPKYTVTFDTLLETSFESKVVYEGKSISLPLPSSEGYIFLGWFIGDKEVTNSTPITKDLDLTARWEAVIYTITYVIDDEYIKTHEHEFNTDLKHPATPDKEGYTFLGWYIDESLTEVFETSTMPAEDMIVYAKWKNNGSEQTIFYLMPPASLDTTLGINLHYTETVVDLSLGERHSSALTSWGRVFMWGVNDSGELGNGNEKNHHSPVDITGYFDLQDDEFIIKVDLAGGNSAALTSKGRVFTWGLNNSGQLGDGTTTNKNTPVDITNHFNLREDETIIDISNAFLSIALSSEGRVFTWGDNSEGYIGDGSTIDRHTPTDITPHFQLDDNETVVNILVKGKYLGVLTSNSRLFIWGDNYYTQHWDETLENKSTPQDVTNMFDLEEGETISRIEFGHFHGMVLTSNNRIYVWGMSGSSYEYFSPKEITDKVGIKEDESIIEIGLGRWYSIILLSNGRIISLGSERYAQPEEIDQNILLTEDETITQLSVGYAHSAIVTSKGKLFTWGANDAGQLGHGITSDIGTPKEVKTHKFDIINSEKFYTGDNFSDYKLELEGYIFDGWYYDINMAEPFEQKNISADLINLYGAWRVIEYNIIYHLNEGFGDENPDYYTVNSATFNLSEPQKEGYTFKGWFSSETFDGERIETISKGTKGDITLYAKWEITEYLLNYIIVSADLDLSKTIPLFPEEAVSEVVLSAGSTVLLTTAGRVITWGRNDFGQLGNGSYNNIDVPTDITANFELAHNERIDQLEQCGIHIVAKTSNGRVFAWGNNWGGQLGNVGIESSPIPIDITSQFDLNIDEKILFVRAGAFKSAVVTNQGRMFVFGNHGFNNPKARQMLDITKNFNLEEDEKLSDIALGHLHTIVLTSNNRVFTWGLNEHGQLGDGTLNDSPELIEITHHFDLLEGEVIVHVSTQGLHSLAKTSKGNIYTWGSNDQGQLGDGTVENRLTPKLINSYFDLSNDEFITDIFTNGTYSGALTSKGNVYTWGNNEFGKLGDGTSEDKHTPVNITSFFDLTESEKVKTINLGGTHASVVIIDDYMTHKRILMWGENYYGQLNIENSEFSLLPSELSFTTLKIEKTKQVTYTYRADDYLPTLEGYQFSGWYSDVAMTQPFRIEEYISNNTFLYGTWVPKP